MIVLPLAAVPFIMKLIGIIWVIVALMLILMVLVQKGRGGGLTAAFGGGGAGGGLLGTKTGDFLTWVTIGLVVVWLLLSVVAAKWFAPVADNVIAPTRTRPAAQTLPAQTELPVLELTEANEPNTVAD